MKTKAIFTGLDIGTTKVVALIARYLEDDTIEVIGHSCQPSTGLKRGVVVDVAATRKAVQNAIIQAEEMAGCEVGAAVAGIAGSHIKGMNSNGIVAIRHNEVGRSDLKRVLNAAKTLAIPADQKILHVLPQEFTVDDQGAITAPLGMSGVRLEARVHIVTAAVSVAQNIVNCVESCGVAVQDLVLEQLASSYAVLTEDERNLGVCLIDIGGGTTDIAVFIRGVVRHTAVVPIAGDQVTNDVAITMRTPLKSAEAVKVKYAVAAVECLEEDKMVEVALPSGEGVRSVSRKELSAVVEARYQEIFSLVKAELTRSGFDKMIPSGMVMTGGASRIMGAKQVAERCLAVSVRVACPRGVGGIVDLIANPAYATAVGLLLNQKMSKKCDTYLSCAGILGLWVRVKNWFVQNL